MTSFCMCIQRFSFWVEIGDPTFVVSLCLTEPKNIGVYVYTCVFMCTFICACMYYVNIYVCMYMHVSVLCMSVV